MKKNMFSLRTKAEVIVVACLLISVFAVNVMSVTRTITDTSDTKETYIHESKGNYWQATRANIQVAIDDCGNASGSWVKLGTANYTVTGNINVWYNVTLDLAGSTIYASNNNTVFTVHPLGKLTSSTNEGIIDVTGVGEYNTSIIVIAPYVNTVGTPKSRQSVISAYKRTSVQHVSIISNAQQGIGLYLHVDANNENIGTMIFDDIYMQNLYRGIYLHNDDAAGFINANYFSHIFIYKVIYAIYLEEVQNEISGNMFTDINIQPTASTTEYHAITMVGNCKFNMFTNLVIWDWVGSGDVTESIYLSVDADHNYFHGIGFADAVSTYYEDHGLVNTFISTIGSRFFVFEVNTTHINRFAGSDTGGGTRFYSGTDENPYTYFYGDKAGIAKYVAHRVDSAGNWDFITQDGDINFAPSTDIVEINDILKLTGSTTDPTSLADGMIWYNTTADWFYCRAGGATYTFNLTAV